MSFHRHFRHMLSFVTKEDPQTWFFFLKAMEKKPLRLVFTHLGTISLQIRTKLRKSMKGVLNCCKLQVFSKVKINSVTMFASKTLFPKFLHQVWFTSFSADYAKNSITENVLDTLL